MLYGSIAFLLSLNDQAAILNGFDGGNVKAQVISVSRGPQQAAAKHLSLPAIGTVRDQGWTADGQAAHRVGHVVGGTGSNA